MTVTATPPSSLDAFSFGSGLPSTERLMTFDQRLEQEVDLVHTLRVYAADTAGHCHRATSDAYNAHVNDLASTHAEDSPSPRYARLASMLFVYADYIPAAECRFDAYADGEFHGWLAQDGRVVLDVLTTLGMTELAPLQDAATVEIASVAGRLRHGSAFAGVRHIVLDAPYESTWYPADGQPQPLLTSEVNPALTESGGW